MNYYYTIAFLVAGTLVILVAVHGVASMGRRAIGPTIFMFVVGAALLFEGVTLGIVNLFMGR